MKQTTARLERLAGFTGNTFAGVMPTASPRKRPSGLTVKEMSGAGWNNFPTCMMEYIKD
jgi:hypothetical protein